MAGLLKLPELRERGGGEKAPLFLYYFAVSLCYNIQSETVV